MNQSLMMTEQLLRLTTYIALSAGESAWKGDKFEDWKYRIPESLDKSASDKWKEGKDL